MGLNPFATSRVGEEVLPGIYVLGTERVNFYVIELESSLILIDCGFDAHRHRLNKWLTAHNRKWSDIKAVLLTHGHADHVGFAERLRQQGVPIFLHHADAQLALNDWPHSPPQRLTSNIGKLPVIRLFGEALFDGLPVQPVPKSVNRIAAAGPLEVPGHLEVTVVEVPGHSHGSVAYFLPGRNALFTGDALMTRDPMFEVNGPCTFADHAERDTAARNALAFLEPFGEASLLPGHGNPWIGQGSVARAITQIRGSN